MLIRVSHEDSLGQKTSDNHHTQRTLAFKGQCSRVLIRGENEMMRFSHRRQHSYHLLKLRPRSRSRRSLTSHPAIILHYFLPGTEFIVEPSKLWTSVYYIPETVESLLLPKLQSSPLRLLDQIDPCKSALLTVVRRGEGGKRTEYTA